jgi:hypothetical protein
MTFGEMVTWLQDELGPQAQDAAWTRKIKGRINATYRTLRGMRNWQWLESSKAIAVTASTTAIDLPTGTRAIVSVNLASNGMELSHKPMALEAMENGAPTYRSRGTPLTWDTWAGQLYVAPLPGGDDTLNVKTLVIADDLVQDTDEPLFSEDYHQVILDGALVRLAASDVYDTGIARAAERNYARGLRGLMHTAPPAQPMTHNIHWIQGKH